MTGLKPPNREEARMNHTVIEQKSVRKSVNKKRGKKAGALSFGILVIAYAIWLPFYRIGDYLLCFAVSFLLSRIVSVLASDMDLRFGDTKTAEEPAPLILTGDSVADEVINRGWDSVRAIREENNLNPDEELSKKMDELEDVSRRILKTIEEAPHKASQVRRFIDYYLPTTLKLLKNMRVMDERRTLEESVDEYNIRSRTLSGMDSMIGACRKLLENLYRNDYLDVSTDIDALRQVLKRDGLIETESIGRDIGPISDITDFKEDKINE